MERFWSKVDRSGGPDACWQWMAYKDREGYGRFRVGSRRDNSQRMELAHRVSYRLASGREAGKLSVCHRCDRPLCVNPAHLFIGTNRDNVLDCMSKGRSNPRRGEQHPRSRLTAQDVDCIRKLWATGLFLQRELGKAFGVTREQVSQIVRGVRWSHL